MVDLFVLALLGHMVGDYLLQNQWMAIGKSQPGWTGHRACTAHVLLYTSAITYFTGIHTLLFFLAVAVPHWLIDRYALAWYWIDAKNTVPHTKIYERGPLCAAAPPNQTESNIWKLAFAAPVYIANDNTFHFVCLYLALKYLVK